MNQVAINMNNAVVDSEIVENRHLNPNNGEAILQVNTGPSPNRDPENNASEHAASTAPCPTVHIVTNVNGIGGKKDFLKYVRLVMDCIRTLASIWRLF